MMCHHMTLIWTVPELNNPLPKLTHTHFAGNPSITGTPKQYEDDSSPK